MGCVEERKFSSIITKLIRGIDISVILKLGDIENINGLLPSSDARVKIDDQHTQRSLYTDGIDILTYKSPLYQVDFYILRSNIRKYKSDLVS